MLQTSARLESGLQVLNRFRVAVLSTVLLRSWVLAQFCCDQSAVAMRLFAGLTSAQLALLSRLGTTSRTTDSEYLFWAEFSFHDGEILPQTHLQKWSILNGYGNYSGGMLSSLLPFLLALQGHAGEMVAPQSLQAMCS